MAASAATITAQLLDWHGVGRPRGASAAGWTGGVGPPPDQRRCRRNDPAASAITLMDEVCAKSQTRRHVARPKNGSLARCPKTKAEILNAARSEDGVCDSSHARIFPSLSPHRVAYGIVPFWSCHSPLVAAAATHGRGRYEKEWNAVVPILGCPRSLPSVPPFLSLFFDAATELT